MNSNGFWGTRIYCDIYRYPPSSIKHDLSQGQKCSRPFDLCLFGLFLKRQENIIWVWVSAGFLVSPDFRMAPFEANQVLLTGTKSFLQANQVLLTGKPSPSYRHKVLLTGKSSPSYRQTKSFLQANQVLLTGKLSPFYRQIKSFLQAQVLFTDTKSFLQAPSPSYRYLHGVTYHTGQISIKI